MSVSSDGRLSGFASGSIDVGASSLSGGVGGLASGLVGGDGSLRAGGSLSVEGASGSAAFGAGVTVTASAMSIESLGEVVGVGSTVAVSGSESVRVGSAGSLIELDGSSSDGIDSVGVSASSSLELVSGESVSVSSESGTVSASGDVSVSAGESVRCLLYTSPSPRDRH